MELLHGTGAVGSTVDECRRLSPATMHRIADVRLLAGRSVLANANRTQCTLTALFGSQKA